MPVPYFKSSNFTNVYEICFYYSREKTRLIKKKFNFERLLYSSMIKLSRINIDSSGANESINQPTRKPFNRPLSSTVTAAAIR